MLVAQLTFRGMSLAQGMTLAKLIRLHELQDSAVRSLLKVAMKLPIPILSEKSMLLGERTFHSVGEMVGDLIAFGLSKKLDVEKIGMLIHVTGWFLNVEFDPKRERANPPYSDFLKATVTDECKIASNQATGRKNALAVDR